jgi:hypothetical protein
MELDEKYIGKIWINIMGRGKSGEFDGDDGGTEELTCFIPMTN